MAGKFDQTAADIIQLVGAKKNVVSLTHCVTRLRFVLKDKSKANHEALSSVQYVIKVQQVGEQLQVVVGNKVDRIYEAILETQGISGSGEVEPDDETTSTNKSVFYRLMDVISGILVPTLGVLTAAGIIKGVTSFLALENIGILDPTSGLYMLLYAIGDGFYYFLPIILGLTAARKFKTNEFIGLAIGASFVYPAMVNISKTMEVLGVVFEGTKFQMAFYNTLFGIPVIMPGAGYTGSVFPVIVAVFIASKIEKWCKNHITENLRGILTPVITLILTVFV